jgi:hypothetical protein
MNKVLTLLAIGITVSGTLVSCKQTGKTKTENRMVSDFNAIQLSAPVNATIKIDNTVPASVQLTGYDNILDKIKTEVIDNTLIIKKDGVFHFDLDKDVKAIITIPSIHALTISGAADADLKGNITGDEFNLKVSGAGDVKIENINTNVFTSSLSGAGSLEIAKGIVNTASYKVAGAGDIDAFPLVSKDVKAMVSGAGDISLSAIEHLDVHISGAGDVKYKGTPVISSDINGIGSLESVK